MKSCTNFYVYALLDPRKLWEGKFSNEPIYIGYGINDRMFEHNEYSSNRILGNKIAKIKREGFDLIRVKIREELAESEATDIEKDYIISLGKLIDGKGPLCNIADGGYGGNTLRNHPEKETIFKKIIETKKERKSGQYSEDWASWMIGKKFTRSDETKQKISENHADISGENNPMWGKKHTDETREKMKNSKQKFLNSDKAEDFFRRVSEGNFLRGKSYDEVFSEEKSKQLKSMRAEVMKKMRENCTKVHWVTDQETGKYKRVSAEEIETYLSNGYVRGRVKF